MVKAYKLLPKELKIIRARNIVLSNSVCETSKLSRSKNVDEIKRYSVRIFVKLRHCGHLKGNRKYTFLETVYKLEFDLRSTSKGLLVSNV